jgi:hypothetical protein
LKSVLTYLISTGLLPKELEPYLRTKNET